jgi:hypothetical protein
LTLAGGLILIALWLGLWFILSISMIRQIQLVRRTRTTWISALPATGRVEVTGKAQGESISSPMAEKPCVVWQVEVLRIHQSRNRTTWKRIFGSTSPNSFMVDDSTGKILIKPEDAEIILPEGELIEDTGEILWGKLEKLGFQYRTVAGEPDTIQVYERRVTDGEGIYVTGYLLHDHSGFILMGKPSDTLAIRTQSEAATLGKLYGQVVLKGIMTFFILLGAAIIYYGLLLS